MNFAIIAYPLSDDFQNKIYQLIGEPIKYLLVSELRKLPLTKLFSLLRKLDANYLLLPIEDNSSQALLPLLISMAAFAKKKYVEIIFPDLQRMRCSKFASLVALPRILFASVLGRTVLWRSQYEIKKLLQTPQEIIPISKNNSRALYLNTNLWFGIKAGGSVGHIAGVLNELHRQNLEMHYASVGGRTLINQAVKFTDIKLITSFTYPAELNYYRFNLYAIKQLLKKYKNLPLKFIYQRLSLANYTGVILSHRLKVPLVIEYNGSESWVAKNWGTPLRFSKQAEMAEEVCLKHAHLVVTISQVLKDELVARGVDADKIVYYPNCIDPEIFNANNFTAEDKCKLRARYNIAHDKIVLTFVGTFGMWHGVEVLAKAIQTLIDQNENWMKERKVHFMLVGNGAKMPEVRSILNQKKYDPYVTLTGLIPQSQAPAYLSASDILLSPHVSNLDGSKFFGSPTKLFEYMAMGKAILASDLEQIGEILKNSLHVENLPDVTPNMQSSQLAVLCKPNSIEELILGIRFLTEQESWRNILGANARKEALTKYTWKQHVDLILQKLSNQ